jgi:hypothetical protein
MAQIAIWEMGQPARATDLLTRSFAKLCADKKHQRRSNPDLIS